MKLEKEAVEDILEHHGVKGMKWGVQQRITKSAAFKRFSKASDANVQRHFARKTAKREKAKVKAGEARSKATQKAEDKAARKE